MMKEFPILFGYHNWRCGVPWSLVEYCGDQAMTNHGQTLKRLAQRGGLSPREVLALIRKVRFTDKTILAIKEKKAQEILDGIIKRVEGLR